MKIRNSILHHPFATMIALPIMEFAIIWGILFQPSSSDISEYQIEITNAIITSLIIVFCVLILSLFGSKVIGKTIEVIYEKLKSKDFIMTFDSYRYAYPIYFIFLIILSMIIVINSNVNNIQLEDRIKLFIIFLWMHCMGTVMIHSNRHTTLLLQNKKNWFLAKANFELTKNAKTENNKLRYFTRALLELDNFYKKNCGLQIKIKMKNMITNDFVKNIEHSETMKKYQTIFDCEKISCLRMQLQNNFTKKEECFAAHQPQPNYQKISIVIALFLLGIVGSKFLIDFIFI